MGEKYLPENTTVFRCSGGLGPVTFQCKETMNRRVRESGCGVLLTQAAKAMPAAGLCSKKPYINGAPQPCVCPQIVSWSGCSKNRASGSALLTEKSKASCFWGGSINKMNVGTHVEKSSAPATDAFAALAAAATKAAAPARSGKGLSGPAPPMKQRAAADNAGAASPTHHHPQGAVGQDAAERPGSVAEASSKTAVDDALRQDMLCSYGNQRCTAAMQEVCRYLALCRERKNPAVNNNSVALRHNYLDKFDDKRYKDSAADERYQELLRQAATGVPGEGKDWSYAAHHILSGNQVFAQNSEILRLATALDFDINQPNNCIMLVSKPRIRDEQGNIKSYRELGEDDRGVDAYDGMRTTGLQWHLGQHQYSFSEAEKRRLREAIPTDRDDDIRCYADVLSDDLWRLTERWQRKKEREFVCYCEKERADSFLNALGRLIEQVKEKLSAFSNNPRDSYPYYVSREAYLYAFLRQRCDRVMAVWLEGRGGQELCLQRFSVTSPIAAHRGQADFLAGKTLIEPGEIAEEVHRLPLHSDETEKEQERKKCIAFCRNFTHFVLIGGAREDMLPFAEYVKVYHLARDFVPSVRQDMMSLFHNDDIAIRLSRWLRDTADDEYIAPREMIRKRLKAHQEEMQP